MAFSRAFSVISIVSVSWLAAVGCGDDDGNKQQPGASGEGGEAGQGGTSAAGTSNGGTSSAGDAGQSPGGTGGTGGDAGSGTGGQPVNGGAGGAGGEAPLTPVGGAAGEGGVGGAGGEGGDAPALFGKCGYECDTNEDCAVASVDNGLKCNIFTHRCENPRDVCEADADCLASASQWSVSCQSDGACAQGEACVVFRGVGYCAIVAGDEGSCDPMEPKDMPHISGEGSVEVCVGNYGRCWDNKCDLGCDDPQFFGFKCEGAGDGDTCDVATGRCTCAAATQADECDTELCGADNLCVECVSAADCSDSPKGPECSNGKCGCGAASSCPTLPAASAVCE